MGLDEDEVRKINLIEVLREDSADEGLDVSDLPSTAARNWQEDDIRAYFEAKRQGTSFTHPAPSGPTAEQLHARFPPAPADEFRKWFPGLALSNTATANPRWRVLCFPPAGCAEDIFTSEGSGPRRARSPLLEWCRANGAECLGVQPPGRNLRNKEPPFTRAQDLAAALLPVLACQLIDVPYVIVAHSVGTWNAFEFLHLARAAGLPMPRAAFFSAMASPDIPFHERPWRAQATLTEEDFKAECREWDVNEVIFSKAMWGIYHSIMRADFTLFDEYEYIHEGDAVFDFPIVAFYGESDKKIKQKMLVGWEKFTTEGFKVVCIEGHHLWPFQKEQKQQWLDIIASELTALTTQQD